jgi:hypothetical protein
MNGANTEPWAKINKAPKSTITIMIGNSHSFLRLLKNTQSSFRNPIENP